ncbi:MAG TPA: hypothetical protein VKT49_19230 [Bryobacteraceae bacterium]|nr:hypothetical protein [Bryobacteraceae bacterium]
MQVTIHPPAPAPNRVPRQPVVRHDSTAATLAAIDGPNLEQMSLDGLRRSIRANRVSFPSQAPVFPKHDRPDLQWKFAQLYFVAGWNCRDIATKYGLIRQRVQQVLNTWKKRAVQMGYLQYIPTAEAVELMLADVSRQSQAPRLAPMTDQDPVAYLVPMPSAPGATRGYPTRG